MPRLIAKCYTCGDPIVSGEPYVVRTIHYPKESLTVAMHERCSKRKARGET